MGSYRSASFSDAGITRPWQQVPGGSSDSGSNANLGRLYSYTIVPEQDKVYNRPSSVIINPVRNYDDTDGIRPGLAYHFGYDPGVFTGSDGSSVASTFLDDPTHIKNYLTGSVVDVSNGTGSISWTSPITLDIQPLSWRFASQHSLGHLSGSRPVTFLYKARQNN